MNYIVLLISLFLPNVVYALEVIKSPPDLTIGSMIASLFLVIACIFVFAFLMKKSNLLHNRRGNTLIKVIATQALTNKARVQIIEVNETRYLLGVTEQNVNLLGTLPIPEDEKDSVPASLTTSPFSTLFSKISIKRNE